LFHYFERFLQGYESRFERDYGYFYPIIKEVTAGHHERRESGDPKVPRETHEVATSLRSSPQAGQRMRVNPQCGLPQSR